MAGAVLLTLSLGGCAGLGLPFDPVSNYTGSDGNVDPAAARAAVPNDRVDPSDWETVRVSLAGAPQAASDRLEWLNPDTGSTGTIGVAEAVTKDGVACRAFSTTVNDVRGVRRYRGEICSVSGGSWQFRSITPDDAAIS